MKNQIYILALTLIAAVFVSSTFASTVDYKILIDDVEAAEHVLVAGTHNIKVQVRVSDNDLTGGGVHGGLLQSAFNLSSDTNLAIFEDILGGFLGGPDAKWDSTANPDFDSHFQGIVDNGGGPFVLAETGAIAPGDFTAQFGDIGANVFTLVTEGNFDWNASANTVLSLVVANPFGGDIVVAGLNGSVIIGANPDVVNNTSTILSAIPEPGTMILASFGLLGLLGTRRSCKG